MLKTEYVTQLSGALIIQTKHFKICWGVSIKR